MGWSELFSKSWEEYKQNFWLFVKIFLVFSLIPAVIILLAGYTQFSEIYLSPAIIDSFISDFSLAPPGFWLFVGITFIITLVLSLIMTLSYVYVSLHLKKKGSMGFKDAVGGGMKYFWSYILLTLLLVILLIPLFLLLIIPGIIFVIYWILSSYILLNEGVGPWESMKRSMRMIKGRWWNTLGYLILLVIVLILISIAFSLPESITVIAMGLSPLATLTSGQFILFSILGFITSLEGAVTTPLVILFFKNYYLELKGKSSKKK